MKFSLSKAMENSRLTVPMTFAFVAFLAVSLSLLAGSSEATKRVDCQSFCKKTSFTGMVGGCKCGYTLFSYKRGAPMVTPGSDEDDSRDPNADLIRTFGHPRQNGNTEKPSADSDESGYLWRPLAEVLRISRPNNRQRIQWKEPSEEADVFVKSFV